MRKRLDDVLRQCLDLSTHHGGIHDIYMWYSEFHARMHCFYVAMSIGTLVYLLVMFDCIMKSLGDDNAYVKNDGFIPFNMINRHN
jgi:hypothetical protein